MKKYRFGLDIWGLALFFLIMIPNFIWFAIPAPHDILRVESVTPIVDTIASIAQVIMIICLCIFSLFFRSEKYDCFCSGFSFYDMSFNICSR